MQMDAATALLPLIAMAAAIVAFPRRWLVRDDVRAAVVAALAFVVLRYLWWRLTVTVWPAEGWSVQSAFVWGLFAVEMVAWFDGALLFAALLRRTDRSPEADAHEARLRGMDPADLPAVDVMIATYDEPLDVLERSVAGALAIDWPADRLRVHVLDDGRRDWLRDFAAQKGVTYLTRADNAHAKAGNINAAIARTDAPFFLVLDADFVPQRRILYRALGFFADEGVGIVQIPHNFFNNDPMQANLAMHRTLPDDQRLFFDAIMPGRDGWDCAFCCGSNAITRRAAIEAVGGGLPTGSITEDMLLTLAMLRKGFVTRYLNERLAIGLAPESLAAFFVQRARWARGAMQILFLRDGPLGPGLRLPQRLLFLPTHWLSQSLSQTAAMSVPAIYLWTGLLPLLNADGWQVAHYQIPAILGTVACMRLFAPGEYFPLASTAHGVLQAFRLLPVILATLVRPHGHAFRVTPKGRSVSGGAVVDRPTLAITIGLMVATALGLLVNANYNVQIVGNGNLVPVVAFWAVVNMLVLLVVATIAVTPPRLRTEERFAVEELGRLRIAPSSGGAAWLAEIRDLSLSGARLLLDAADSADADVPGPGDWIALEVAGVGAVPALVRRSWPSAEVPGTELGVEFDLPVSARRDALIAKLFTEGRDNSTHVRNVWWVSWQMMTRIVQADRGVAVAAAPRSPAPDWLAAEMADEAQIPRAG